MYIFFSRQLWRLMKRSPRGDFLPSTGLQEEPELWYQQRPLAPIHLLGECRRIWVSLSQFLNLWYWLRLWVLFGCGAGYLPPPSRKDTGREPGWNIQGILTHGLDTSGAPLKDTEKSPPRQRYCVAGGWLVERCLGNYPPGGKVLGRGAWMGEKKLSNSWGLAERCRQVH